MNRRRVLQVAGVAATTGLAGCIDGVREHFGLQGIIPLEIHSEADRTYNLHLEAYEREARRKSYEQSISVSPGETVGAPNLNKTDQSFRIARIEGEEQAEVQEVSLTEATTLVTIMLYDDEFVVEVRENESDDATNETVTTDVEGDAETNDTETTDTD
ncbi:hypothetical protein [Natronorubrum sulfidifaciens]|uniref:Uncharacterized protein n=1 Tax=Natronorubrum sulfidifaciens JCM 14089 TaxID=1230460 RepID=L9VZW4_9EURY|nr:hypothetical protein [Natronorubrum sulfidifaciens]ELY42591.1 hypothetical protein C495_14797 [Natronorubrum sulfidifaciens JCM 14089]